MTTFSGALALAVEAFSSGTDPTLFAKARSFLGVDTESVLRSFGIRSRPSIAPEWRVELLLQTATAANQSIFVPSVSPWVYSGWADGTTNS